MKNLIISLLIVNIILALTSCQKNFLDEVPAENFTVDSIYANHDNAQAALTTIYNALPQNQLYLSPFSVMAFTGCSDEMEMPWPEKYNITMIAGAWNPNDFAVWAYWNNNYNAIRKANMFLQNIGKTPMDPNEKTRWIGEAHFLRAFFYFLLFRLYGPVPIIDHVINTDADFSKFERDPINKVADFIVHDCDTAAALLPMTYSNTSDYGRATKAAALALKSRLLLYMASPLYNGSSAYAGFTNKDGTHLFPTSYNQALWQQAADAAKQCIDLCESAGYALYYSTDGDPEHSYQGLFLNNWNSEVLFARNEGNTWDANDLNRTAFPNGMGGWGGLSPTQELVDAYQMSDGQDPVLGYNADGSPIINPNTSYTTSGFATVRGKYWPDQISNRYVNREPRFYASINYNGAWWAGRRIEFWLTGTDGLSGHGRDHDVTGYLMKKGIDSTINIPQGKWVTTTWIYFRLGEQYLNYAEALNEAQGPVADVYKYVNAIRARGGLPGLPIGLSQDQMRQKIHHERRIEMAFEMQRYFDCRRWKTAENDFAGQFHGMDINAGNSLQDPSFYVKTVTSNRIFTMKDYLWPIPQSEINKDQDLVQNPGW